jgi:hypothetical protein
MVFAGVSAASAVFLLLLLVFASRRLARSIRIVGDRDLLTCGRRSRAGPRFC